MLPEMTRGDDKGSQHSLRRCQVKSEGSSVLGRGLGKGWCQVNRKKKFHPESGVKGILEVT